jgi:hypothetical protein
MPSANGWSPLEAVDAILGPRAWEEFGGMAVDFLLLRTVMRRGDLCFSGCPFPGDKRQRVPKELAETLPTRLTGPFSLNVLERTLRIERDWDKPTLLVDVRIEARAEPLPNAQIEEASPEAAPKRSRTQAEGEAAATLLKLASAALHGGDKITEPEAFTQLQDAGFNWRQCRFAWGELPSHLKRGRGERRNS